MAEHLLSSAASAVTGELTRALFSGLMGKLDRKAASAADKKLRRLDMLLIKINSAVEASEKHAIGNASLVKWRDKLKEAAAEGDEVLASFRQREMEVAAAAQATGDGDDANAQQHRHQEDPSSSSASAASTVSATAITGNNNNAPSAGMAQGIFSATKTLLFSREEDMERLNNAVERLQDLSRDISIFIKLLKLEVLASAAAAAAAPAQAPEPAAAAVRALAPGLAAAAAPELAPEPAAAAAPAIWAEKSGNLKRKPAAAAAAAPAIWTETSGNSKRTRLAYDSSGDESPLPSFKLFGIPVDLPAGRIHKADHNQTAAAPAAGEGSTLLGRLEEAFATICRAVELADGRDLSGREWLAYWASILREAKRQGCAVLGAISTVAVDDAGAGDEVAARCDDDQEDSELGRFVCNMESLAGEADSFSDLAFLCSAARFTVLVS